MSDDAHRGQSTQPSVGERDGGDRRKSLKERSLLVVTDEEEESADLEPELSALRRLIERVDCQETTYQSVAVAALQILEQALFYEREAADAALSLGQQKKLESMVEAAEQAVSVLRDTLTSQGHKVMHLCQDQSNPAPAPRATGQPWWFALTDALEVLEEGTDRMTSLTTGQPADSPARRLSQLIAQFLRGHHDALLLEAEEWIS